MMIKHFVVHGNDYMATEESKTLIGDGKLMHDMDGGAQLTTHGSLNPRRTSDL